MSGAEIAALIKVIVEVIKVLMKLIKWLKGHVRIEAAQKLIDPDNGFLFRLAKDKPDANTVAFRCGNILKAVKDIKDIWENAVADAKDLGDDIKEMLRIGEATEVMEWMTAQAQADPERVHAVIVVEDLDDLAGLGDVFKKFDGKDK